MKLDKSTKRIAKRVKKGFQGYPEITLAYFGETTSHATEVTVKFVLEEGAEAQEERFASQCDIREDEVIQTTLLKIIERANAKTVTEIEGVSIIQ